MVESALRLVKILDGEGVLREYACLLGEGHCRCSGTSKYLVEDLPCLRKVQSETTDSLVEPYVHNSSSHTVKPSSQAFCDFLWNVQGFDIAGKSITCGLEMSK